MLDIHCHMLPGFDHGPGDLSAALAMARSAVADGIRHSVCTPPLALDLSTQDTASILAATQRLAEALAQAGLPLSVSAGAALPLQPDLLPSLRQGRLPTLAGSRYYLLKLPDQSAPAGFTKTITDSLTAGYVPIIAHPERFDWLNESQYHRLVQATQKGAWLMVTAGAVTGHFGRTARRWAERLLDDGLVHLLASDVRAGVHQRPRLAEGRDAAAHWVGAAEAERLVRERPAAVIANRPPSQVTPPPALVSLKVRPAPAFRPGKGSAMPWLGRLLGVAPATQ